MSLVKQISAAVVFVSLGCSGGLVGNVAKAATPKDGEVGLPADYASWPKFLTGCGKSLPAAFSRHSAAHRTARVRFAPSLAAALLDGLFAHPVACRDA